jgi:hypothetical protein
LSLLVETLGSIDWLFTLVLEVEKRFIDATFRWYSHLGSVKEHLVYWEKTAVFLPVALGGSESVHYLLFVHNGLALVYFGVHAFLTAVAHVVSKSFFHASEG